MRTKIDIRPNTYIYMVLLLLLIPIKWLLAWGLAAGFHEICHWFAAKLCGGEIRGITVGLGGAKMECSPMPKGKRVLTVLSGPIGGLLPLLFAQWMPRTALCCWFLSMYNMLPLICLDGGKVIEILLGARAVIVQRLFLLVLSLVAVYVATVLDLGLLPMIIAVLLWLKSRNNPCKPGVSKVQ